MYQSKRTFGMVVPPWLALPHTEPHTESGTGQPHVSAASLQEWLRTHQVVDRLRADLDQTLARYPREDLLNALMSAGQAFLTTDDRPNLTTLTWSQIESTGATPIMSSAAARLAAQRLLMLPPAPPRATTRPRYRTVDHAVITAIIAQAGSFSSASQAQLLVGMSTDKVNPQEPYWTGSVRATIEAAPPLPDHTAHRSATHMVRFIYEPARFDLLGYLTETRARETDQAEYTQTWWDSIVRANQDPDLWDTEAMDPDLRRVCRAMRTDLGFDLWDLALLSATLSAVTADPLMAVFRAPLDFPQAFLADLDSRDGRARVAAFHHLTCTREGLLTNNNPHMPTMLRGHAVRLNTHPIVRLKKHYLIAVRLVEQTVTQHMYLARLGDWPVKKELWKRQWPHLYSELIAENATSLKRLRGDKFEAEVASRLTALGLPMLRKVNVGAHIASLVIPGEIDHLIIDPETRQIWVLEDKDMVDPLLPLDARSTVAKFFDEPDKHAEKNDRNVRTISTDTTGVAAYVAERTRTTLPPEVLTQPWTVHGVLVVRDLGPMGWVIGIPSRVVDAVTVVDLIRTDIIAAHERERP